MSILRGDAVEVYRLAADLSKVPAKTIVPLRGVMQQAGEAFAQEWKANAAETSGAHGVHYPNSITAELAFDITGISVDVGPDSGMLQGGMGAGFEFGSVNQPPHLDGLRALDGMQMRAERMIDSAVAQLLP